MLHDEAKAACISNGTKVWLRFDMLLCTRSETCTCVQTQIYNIYLQTHTNPGTKVRPLDAETLFPILVFSAIHANIKRIYRLMCYGNEGSTSAMPPCRDPSCTRKYLRMSCTHPPPYVAYFFGTDSGALSGEGTYYLTTLQVSWLLVGRWR